MKGFGGPPYLQLFLLINQYFTPLVHVGVIVPFCAKVVDHLLAVDNHRAGIEQVPTTETQTQPSSVRTTKPSRRLFASMTRT